MMNTEILNIQGLKTHFYTEQGVVKAVDGISLRMFKGETLGLVGESGSGKSVTALSVMGLIPFPGKIVEGSIFFKGKNLLQLRESEMRKLRGDEMTMIFQDPMSSLNPVFTIGYQVAEVFKAHRGAYRQGLSTRSEVNKKVSEILRSVGIAEPAKRQKEYPHQFSGGMRQRVMIAISLANDPSLLIADEPTTNLDVTIQAQILELMKRLKERFSSSILLITHDLGVVAEMADRVAVMYAGRIMEYASADTIFRSPLHPYTEGLLRSIPRLDLDVERLPIIPGTLPDSVNTSPGCRFHPRCEYCKEICKQSEPQLVENTPGHLVACFRSSETDWQST
jgi:oligopeptide/dipeptide ABC transporter ATP-binding protein